ncbi:hypothetical protein PUMCH_000809 [Australozyma saopauloensis]|uniref:Autophagy-related protein 11 n=1 Tax=Australozyma saopauloensis TaxID=291208 RepID=A0AAX4H547_9ASCO|nr:hypothetical protein PUMCH_000809 [[Candida] saopauloensis]
MTAPIAQILVYNAHNGDCVEIPKPVRFHSLSALRDYLLEAFTHSSRTANESIFLLTPFGIKLNFQMINEMSEIYYYDRRFFDKATDKAEALQYLSSHDEMPVPKPDKYIFVETDNEREIVKTFESYEQWARNLLLQTTRTQMVCDSLTRKINYIFKSLNIIFQFVSNFVKTTEKAFSGFHESVKLLWTKSLSNSWQSHYAALKSFPPIHFKNSSAIYLYRFLDEDEFRASATLINRHLPKLVSRFNAFSDEIDTINDGTLEIDKMIEALRSQSAKNFKGYDTEKKSMGTEIDSFSTAFSEDSRVFHSLSRREQRVLYQQHKLLSVLFHEVADKAYSILNRLSEFHRMLVTESVPIFQEIALLQLKAVTLRNDSKALMVKQDSKTKSIDQLALSSLTFEIVEMVRNAENNLSMTIDLPLLFGFTLVEQRRQFEWHDFFLKGLVNGVSEQLSVIIEHESTFQNLWIKKFGQYIKKIDPQIDLLSNIPSIDVTLVNSNANSNEHNVFGWNHSKDFDREDIIGYIAILKKQKLEKFSSILEKNFKDMVHSTDQMNKMSKTVSALSAHVYLDEQAINKSQTKLDGIGTSQLDQNLVEGLKMRIKKLENLLHQNQFRNINNWPVVRADQITSANQMSLIMNGPATTNTINQNPLKFLQRVNSTPEKRTTPSIMPQKVLDASTTIDKHLDNIRLRRESTELVNHNQELLRTNNQFETRVLELENQLREITSKHDALENQLQDKATRCEVLEKELEEISKSYQSLATKATESENKLDEAYTEIESQKAQFAQEKERSSKEKEKADAEIDSHKIELAALKSEVQDHAKTKSDLLTTMLEKEQDFASERSDLQREINELQEQLSQKTESLDKITEVLRNKQKRAQVLLVSLNQMLRALFHAIEDLSSLSINYFHEFCLVTQSMGLLLVREPRKEDGKMEYRIKRVKGLRERNNEDSEQDHLPSMKTAAINDVEKAFKWLEVTKNSLKTLDKTAEPKTQRDPDPSSQHIPTEEESETILRIFGDFLLPQNSEPSLLNVAVKALSFKEDIQLQGHDKKNYVDEGFFYNGIAKRFSDVEGYAKKLTKENKVKTAEVARLCKERNEKIAINNFQVGDLVLFLPTITNDETDSQEQTPWTAFNIDAPHYFLDLESQPQKSSKEWIVAFISKIEVHEVTDSTVTDRTKNPYSLSAGDRWYSVLTQATKNE